MCENSKDDDQLFRLMALFYMAGGYEFREELIAKVYFEVEYYRRYCRNDRSDRGRITPKLVNGSGRELSLQ